MENHVVQPTEALLREAIGHLRAGATSKGMALCSDVLRRDPANPDALY